VRELLSKYESRRRHADREGSALKALEGDKSEIGVPSVVKLVEEMDRYIPVRSARWTVRLMPVEDVFDLGRGTVVTGRIERGIVR